MFSRLFGKKKKEDKQAVTLPDDMRSWTVQHVTAWLEKNDLKEYSDAFVKNAISGGELADLTEKDLETLGVKKLGSRKKLIKIINDMIMLKRDSSYTNEVQEMDLGSESSLHSSSTAPSSAMGMRPANLPIMPDHLDQKYALFEDLPDGTIVINIEKTIMFVNKTVERIFLYDRSDLLGCNIKVLMPEPHRSRHDGYVDKYLNGGKASVVGKGRMVEAKAKDNSLVPIWLSVTEAVDDDGNKIFIGSFKDLRAVNPVSKSSQNKMLMLLDNLVDAAVVMNVDSTIIFFNKSAENLFGFSKDDTIGNCVEMLMPPEVAKNHKQFVSNYMQTKQGKVIGKGRNVEILKKDGTRQSVFFSLTETKWGEGNTTAFCATLQPLNELVDAKKSAGNQVKKVEQEKILDSNDPVTRQLQEVLDSPTAKILFKNFLEQSKTLEPLLFIEAVDEYIVLKSNFYRYKQAQAIYETFIKHKAPKEINLPSSIRQELLSNFVEKKVTIEHCPFNLFLSAYETILSDLKNDNFTRFKTTPSYKSLVDGNTQVFSK